MPQFTDMTSKDLEQFLAALADRRLLSTVALMLHCCVRLSSVIVCIRNVLLLNGASYRKVTIDSL